MQVSAFKNNVTISLSEVRKERCNLAESRDSVMKQISSITNTVNELNRTIKGHCCALSEKLSLRDSFQSIEEKHGGDAPVRLKNDHLKYGQASNFFKKMFHSARYLDEREAAARHFKADRSTVSIGKVIEVNENSIQGHLSQKIELEKVVAGHCKKINTLNVTRNALQVKIDNLASIETKAKKAENKKSRNEAEFAQIYQSSNGCKAINRQARFMFGNGTSPGELKESKVIGEYESRKGGQIFGRANKELEATIRANCNNLSYLVKMGADAFYNPGGNHSKTIRGQGMTQRGIDSIVNQYATDKINNTETVYKLGQFFSTTKDAEVADYFASISRDPVKVMFHVTGNSGSGLHVQGGLKFDNDESEILYSPLAHFKLAGVERGRDGVYWVQLKEVPQVDRARVLPH